jgi:formylglycine-generating enzyme required for sulfatase activity
MFEHIPKKDLEKAVGKIRWKPVPEGEFLMGSPEGEKGRVGAEGPQHRVRFACGFEVMDAPVTHSLYECFDPGHYRSREDFQKYGKGIPIDAQEDVPAHCLTWYEAQMFGEWIGSLPATSGCRLPLEAEWEYFCRAGSGTAYNFGDSVADLTHAGWIGGNSDGHPQPVRQKERNAWGLYDCHGNVWEWCKDEVRRYRHGDLELDPRAIGCNPVPKENVESSTDAWQVVRGGSWRGDARVARSAFRSSAKVNLRGLDLGFRLIRVPPAGSTPDP